MQKNKNLPFYIIVLALFIGVTAKSMFTDGMFMDGLWYAVISRNLAEGIGSFWDLYFTQTVYPHFHEHPPLAFGMQSIFFRMFGNSILTERFYSFFTFVFTGLIMVLLWNKTTLKKYRSLDWLPLFFFVITPLIIWCVSNNLLENTMMIFTSLSVLFIILSLSKNRWLNLLLAGVMLYLGFLTKGPVALFPLSLPLWIYIINHDISFKRVIIDTTVVVIGLLTPFLVVYLIEPASIESLLTYFNHQVVGSLKNARSVDSRLYIIENLLNNLIPIGILMLIVFLLTVKSKVKNQRSKWTYVFLALGLSGVIPIMVSMKQSSFYMLASFPFIIIALAEMIAPRVYFFTNRINYKSVRYKRFNWFSYLFLILCIVVTALQSNRIDRDKETVEDVYAIIEIVPENTILSIQSEMANDWSLHGYFYRHAHISLDYEQKFNAQYIIVQKGYSGDLLSEYEIIPMELNQFDLYKKRVP